jgi:hypothetical protein
MKLVIALCVVMVPAAASAQHRGADTGTGGAAVSIGSSSSSGGSSSSSSGDNSSSSNSGSVFQSSSNTGGSSGVGHRTGSISVPPPNLGAANSNNGAFTNYSNLTFSAPEFARPRSSLPLNTAFTKGSVPTLSLNNPNTNNGVTFLPAYNPWLYAYGSLYGGLYGIPFYGAFDPFAVDFGYVGPTVWTTTTPSSPVKSDKGILRLNVKPYDAEVHVDGVLVGKANHFEGVFHKLRLDAGVHRLELRASGYEPLVVNVRIEGGESMTYRGSLEKTAP